MLKILSLEQAPVLVINSLFFTAIALGVVLSYFLPHGPIYPGSSFGLKLLSGDGRWYFDIAFNGYKWDPVNGVRIWHYNNMAFFPLYPLIERSIIFLTGSINPFVFIMPGLVFGLMANFFFYKFSRRLLLIEQAWWATAFFALWPACCFMVMGYPTGLINLLAILSLQNYAEGKKTRAALWCGVGSAAAPTFVFFAAGMCAHVAFEWLCKGHSITRMPSMILFGMLSVSGLIVFMGYQYYVFHDGLAFQKAQLAWAKDQTVWQHILTIINPIWYLVTGFLTLKLVWYVFVHHHAVSEDVRNHFNIMFQFALDEFVFFFGLLVLIYNRNKLKFSILIFTGLFIFFGYLWFVASTPTYFYNGIRLLYPAIAEFLILSQISSSKPLLRYSILLSFSLLTTLETALVMSGYTVI